MNLMKTLEINKNIAEKPRTNTYKITHIVLNNCSLVPNLTSN